MKDKMNFNPNGVWMVSTEADEEGIRYTNLGVYSGRIDEIAFALAEKTFYSLTFRRMNTDIPTPNELRTSVHVVLDEVSDQSKAVSLFQSVLKGSNVRASSGQFYKSVLLERDVPKEAIREKALAKLTNEEKDALGLV